MNTKGLKSSIRLITYSAELVDGKPIHVSSNCLPIKALNFEPAGHCFHSVALKLRGCSEEAADDNDVEDKKVPDKEMGYIPSYDSYESKGKKKSGAGKQHDHYALLGLSHLRYLATEDQIRKSYQKAALKNHPDKLASLLLVEETEAAKQSKKDEIEAHFKLIQEAYEVLTDPARRRIYDSTDEFDDEIPTDCSPQDFFKVFGPAFMRNGKWSVNQPIPAFGDDKTPLKEVDKFYDFWYSFKSWREFPHADEHDIEQAESRDEKRWMERQNAKLTEKARKDEYARIRMLVDNAYKKDPRILRRKEEMKAEKQRKKDAKLMAKRLQEEEAARAVEEEKRLKEEEEKRAAEAAQQQKAAKEKEKKLLRKERTRLRTLSAAVVAQRLLNISGDDVEGLCMSFSMDQLKELCGKIENKEALESAKILTAALGRESTCNDDSLDKKQDEKKNIQQNGFVEVNGGSTLGISEKKGIPNGGTLPGSYEKKEKPWSKEEIDLLRKGVQKYQKGTSRRWEVISEYIGTGRSVEEILKATKTVLLQKPDSAKAFDSFLEKRKPAPAIASPLTTREEIRGVPNPAVPDGNSSNTGKPEESPDKGTKSNQSADKAEAVSGSSSDLDADTWSAVQERALVQALKTFPKETNQRWERVAAAVPGKTMNQCKKKFAELKEILRNKKSTA